MNTLENFQIVEINPTLNDKIALWFAQIIDYTLKYLTSVALLREKKQYCALSSKVYLKLKADNFTLLQNYLPVRNTCTCIWCIPYMCILHTVYVYIGQYFNNGFHPSSMLHSTPLGSLCTFLSVTHYSYSDIAKFTSRYWNQRGSGWTFMIQCQGWSAIHFSWILSGAVCHQSLYLGQFYAPYGLSLLCYKAFWTKLN